MNNLNELLNDLIFLSIKIKNYHWNIVDKDFFSVHKQLDDMHKNLLIQIDDLAELIRSSNVFVDTNFKNYLQTTTINSIVNPGSSANTIIKNLSSDYLMVISKVKNFITPSSVDAIIISDFCTKLLGDFKKTLWMLESSI